MATKYLITDVDGVIFDRMPVYLSAAAEILAPFGFSKDQVRDYFYSRLGTPVGVQIKGILEEAGLEAGEKKVAGLLEKFWSIAGSSKKEPPLFPGVGEVLFEIKKMGIFLMASSGSNTGDLEDNFKKYGLPYDFFLGSDRIPKGDGHIEIFADRFGQEPGVFCKQAAFVGDGTTDMRISVRNGIFGIGITNTIGAEELLEAGARKIISDIRDLPGLLS